MVIPNPDKTGINTSDNVLKFKVNDGADVYAGAFSDSYAPVEFTQNSNIITMMVWKSVVSPVGFKVEGSSNNGPVTEVKVSNTLTNQWEKLTFDFSSLIGYKYNRIVIFPDFPATRNSGTTVYIDNINKIDVTSSGNDLVNSQVNIFPNPVVDVLNVAIAASKAKINIYNSLGVMMESGDFQGPQVRFNVSNYLPGVYYLKVDGGTAVKFVK